jgi:hypothetical protein
MSARHAPKPSPLAGEGAERPRDPLASVVRDGSQKRGREAGEGAFVVEVEFDQLECRDPSPRPRYARAPLSRKGRGDGARCSMGAQQ